MKGKRKEVWFLLGGVCILCGLPFLLGQNWPSSSSQTFSWANMASVIAIAKYKHLESYLDYQATRLDSSGVDLWWWGWILIDHSGFILTNKHVVDDMGASYRVIFADGRSFSVLHIWLDPQYDVAVVQISGTVADFSPLVLPSWPIHVQRWQALIGFSLIGGLRTGSLTTVVWQGNMSGYLTTLEALPGVSGSPVWNQSGELLGMTTASYPIGSFVLPLSQQFVQQLLSSIQHYGRIVDTYTIKNELIR